MRVCVFAFALPFLLVPALHAQQVADSAFAYPNPDPSFESDAGPRVCVDAGHNNFHTLDGRYYAFGKLVRGDGFRTISSADVFTAETLADCDLLVIANALAAANAENWDSPTEPAFTRGEVDEVIAWIQGGGGLLLIMDHAPFPGAAAPLTEPLGAVPLNGAATYRVFGEHDDGALEAAAKLYDMTPWALARAVGWPGELGDHPILRGREGVDDPIRTLMTFGGSVFFPGDPVQALLTPPPGAFAMVMPQSLDRELWPRFPVDGWLGAGARELGEGRVVILGEAAMCTAQLSGPEERPMGMNHPLSVDNPRFCLNAMRWLAGVL